MTNTEHIAERPSWDCRCCGETWPCDPARDQLVAELSPVRLAMYMWTNLEEAARDLQGMPVAEAFDRFIGWNREGSVRGLSTGPSRRRGKSLLSSG